MGYHVYVPKNFSADHTKIIDQANEILDDYRDQGFTLTLRQLYYQFVSKDAIENSERSYKRLGKIVNDARLAGLISFDMIEDRGRVCSVGWSQPDPASVLDGIEYAYKEDFWEDQPYYVEVWVEKDALSSVIERPCERWNVPHMACKGYMSVSAQWEAGNRFQRAISDGKKVVLLHLGDHDPSGIDMTRDNRDRLSMFAFEDVEVSRLALNMDQIEEHRPPPNPAKVTDSRAKDYIARFGNTSWELDALPPKLIDELIDRNIQALVDHDNWDAKKQRQSENRSRLRKIGENADAVFDYVDGLA